MLSSLRQRLTYANVVSTACLFIVLGGSAYAATGLVGRGGVIQGCVSDNGIVRLVKVSRRCPAGQAAITWNKRGPAGEMGPAGPQGASGQAGPQGATGLQGPAGANGATKVVVRTVFTNEPYASPGYYNYTEMCNSGERATGGGYSLGAPYTNLSVIGSTPWTATNSSSPTGWSVEVYLSSTPMESVGIWAVCASP